MEIQAPKTPWRAFYKPGAILSTLETTLLERNSSPVGLSVDTHTGTHTHTQLQHSINSAGSMFSVRPTKPSK